MTRGEEHRAALRGLPTTEWPAYLTAHSGLPGPRANLELAAAAAQEAGAYLLDALIATDEEYLVFCGVLGLGRLLAEGAGDDVVARLRRHAGDARWRVREAVAMAVQRLGDEDLPRAQAIARAWAGDGNPLVQRAAVAALCDPRLLRTPPAAAVAVEMCDRITRSLAARPGPERTDPAVRTLRQALGYCWSVAVAADSAAGLPAFQALESSTDPDVAWIVRENRRKKRLAALQP